MKRSNYDNMPPFGKKLVHLRKSRHMRQEDLAEALKVSRATISYYESRAQNPTMEFVQKVATFFNVSVDELVLGRDGLKGKPGPVSKLERQLDLIRKLPREKQKAISTVLEMALQNVNAE